LFAEVRDFVLYDFWTTEGSVNEDVFAYSNRCGDERALVVYHNKFAEARGWVRSSVGFAAKNPDGSKRIIQHTVGEGLALHQDERHFTIFRDNATELEYIRSSQELCEHGFYVELGAYTCHVFLDFREVCDNEWRHYEHITAYLNGRGVPSVEAVRVEILLQPVHHPLMELVNAGLFRRLMAERVIEIGAHPDDTVLEEVEEKAQVLVRAIKEFTGGQGDDALVAREIRDRLEVALRLPVLMEGHIGTDLRKHLSDDPVAWGVLFGWLFVHVLGKAVAEVDFEELSRSWLDEWQLGRMLAGVLRDFGLNEGTADYAVTTIKLLTAHQRWFEREGTVEVDEVLSSLHRYSETAMYNAPCRSIATGKPCGLIRKPSSRSSGGSSSRRPLLTAQHLQIDERQKSSPSGKQSTSCARHRMPPGIRWKCFWRESREGKTKFPDEITHISDFLYSPVAKCSIRPQFLVQCAQVFLE
jgi:hypothetical protein